MVGFGLSYENCKIFIKIYFLILIIKKSIHNQMCNFSRDANYINVELEVIVVEII